MKKIYCDICNREVTDTKEYILPKRETVWAEDKFGNKLMPFGETTKPEYKDVCTRLLSFHLKQNIHCFQNVILSS